MNDNTDEILGVIYLLDNDYLNEWLRQTIDPNIRNNWDEIHAEKEFEVFITTTTFIIIIDIFMIRIWRMT